MRDIEVTHVQPDAADGADLLSRDGRKDAVDDGHLIGFAAGVEHARAGPHSDLDLLAVPDSQADVD